MRINDYTISFDLEVEKALLILNDLETKLLFVLDKDEVLIGTVTDGDIRRGLIDGLKIGHKVFKFMNKNFTSFDEYDISTLKFNSLRDSGINIVPILDKDRKIKRLLNLNKYESLISASAVIMAGGRGERLKPLTNEMPKPMIKIGDKPILEHVIDRLIKFGVNQIFISVRYLSEHIISFFGDGSEKGIEIKYIHEDEPLGTIGSLSLVKSEEISSENLILINSDILTNIDFSDMYEKFKSSSSDLIVGSVPYNFDVPYAVLETENGTVKKLSEKPTYNYHVNSGIYMFKKEFISNLKKGVFFNATDFCSAMIKNDKNLTVYPILNYWKDIGRMSDLEKARNDINHIKF